MRLKFFWIPATDSLAAEEAVNAFLTHHRVVHHALMNVAGPVFERGAIGHSYACRTGRGNRAAVLEARRRTSAYRCCLKLDVRRYFDSIPHDRLRSLFRARIKDGAFLDMLDRIVAGFSVTPGHVRTSPAASPAIRKVSSAGLGSFGRPVSFRMVVTCLESIIPHSV